MMPHRTSVLASDLTGGLFKQIFPMDGRFPQSRGHHPAILEPWLVEIHARLQRITSGDLKAVGDSPDGFIFLLCRPPSDHYCPVFCHFEAGKAAKLKYALK